MKKKCIIVIIILCICFIFTFTFFLLKNPKNDFRSQFQNIFASLDYVKKHSEWKLRAEDETVIIEGVDLSYHFSANDNYIYGTIENTMEYKIVWSLLMQTITVYQGEKEDFFDEYLESEILNYQKDENGIKIDNVESEYIFQVNLDKKISPIDVTKGFTDLALREFLQLNYYHAEMDMVYFFEGNTGVVLKKEAENKYIYLYEKYQLSKKSFYTVGQILEILLGTPIKEDFFRDYKILSDISEKEYNLKQMDQSFSLPIKLGDFVYMDDFKILRIHLQNLDKVNFNPIE